MQRGKAGRLEYQRVAQEESAATRIQARHRGMQGRRAAHELLRAQGLDAPSEVGSEEEHVAARDVVAARVAAVEAGIAVDGSPNGVLDGVKVRLRCPAWSSAREI